VVTFSFKVERILPVFEDEPTAEVVLRLDFFYTIDILKRQTDR